MIDLSDLGIDVTTLGLWGRLLLLACLLWLTAQLLAMFDLKTSAGIVEILGGGVLAITIAGALAQAVGLLPL